MMKGYARIDSGVVAELLETDGDIQTMFHPDMVWVECTCNGIAVGWAYSEGVFSPPAHESQEHVRSVKWDSIKSERDRRQMEGGVQVAGHWFLSTERATGEYNSLINASQGLPADTVLRRGWRTMDGAEVDMTPTLARQILLASIAQRSAIDDASLAHKAAMEKSPDPASYDFSGRWPETYAKFAAKG